MEYKIVNVVVRISKSLKTKVDKAVTKYNKKNDRQETVSSLIRDFLVDFVEKNK